MGWSKVQYRDFAKDMLAMDLNPTKVSYVDGRVRLALMEARCLSIVRAQFATSVLVEDIDALCQGVRAEIEKKMGPRFFE